MAKQWAVPPDLFSGVMGGEIVNESSAGGLEWATPGGGLVNEQAAAAAAFIANDNGPILQAINRAAVH